MLAIPGGPKKQPSRQPGAAMTLAQRYGLYPRPAEPLTSQQWQDVHAQSLRRNQATSECAICREEFKEGAQARRGEAAGRRREGGGKAAACRTPPLFAPIR